MSQSRKVPTSAELRSVRIVAGQWRGRRVPFVAVPGLRPTPDRIRETLFNWLQATVVGRHCLDLYAGSGALGLEALSRGAASAVFVERERSVAQTLRSTLVQLGATSGVVREMTAEAYLAGPVQPAGLVFLDPPFALGNLGELCTLLCTRGWLSPGGMVYLEQAARDPLPDLPAGWEIHRETKAGEVRAVLVRAGG